MDSATAGGIKLPGVDPSAPLPDANLAQYGIERPLTVHEQAINPAIASGSPNARPRQRSRRKQHDDDPEDSAKRRCVSTACIACRKRKSKCDGNTPACAACSQVYGTPCIYDPNSDHRRKGVYKNDMDNPKTRSSTLETLIQAILNYSEDEVPALVREIRTCESLDAVAEKIVARGSGLHSTAEDEETESDLQTLQTGPHDSQLYAKMADLRLDDGSVRYIGGTSNLIHIAQEELSVASVDDYPQHEDPVTSWTTATDDPDLVTHLLNMYFTWHYTFFPTLSKKFFLRDFALGKPPVNARGKPRYCTPLLVNAILAIGCHFTSHAGARDDPNDSATAGDHFFREAKRLIMENDEHERPLLTTVQALAIMSVREAGCGREASGWVYSGMSFRMVYDMGLNLDGSQLVSGKQASHDEVEEDVRRMTFWGCYLFDKCWSNYMGRTPQLPISAVTVSKYDVFPQEDADQWQPYTDSGVTQAHAQPSRTRAVGLQLLKLCEINDDIMKYFYNPIDMRKSKVKPVELRKLSDVHVRLEAWHRDLPREMAPKEGCLPGVLVMHMFYQLLHIHLYRPFMLYNPATSPLPSNVDPKKHCTAAATMISKLMRLYKRSHGLRQICNIAVYIISAACTLHLVNLPDKIARRDINHSVKHLEEIAEAWPCARRALSLLNVLVRKWKIELPDEAAVVLARAEARFGPFQGDTASPSSQHASSESSPTQLQAPAQQQYSWEAPAVASAVNVEVGDSSVSPTTATMLHPQFIPVHADNGNFGSLQQMQQTQNLPPAGDNQQLPRFRAWEAGRAVKPGESDMFGGVQQLLRDSIRDSNTWTYRDQVQLGVGFGNWNSAGLDSRAWINSDMTTDQGVPATGQTGAVGRAAQDPIAAPHNGPTYGDTPVNTGGGGGGGGGAQGIPAWLHGLTALNQAPPTYHEEEWYQ